MNQPMDVSAEPLSRESDDEAIPSRCLLSHQVFTAMGQVSFRRAETDNTPVMVIQLGERIAAVPLRSLQREFSIADQSPDGRMLGLIAESLDYVSGLNIGDALPSEVLTGKASWDPGITARDTVARRLKWQLLAWLNGDAANNSAARGLSSLDTDPNLRSLVQDAFVKAAQTLGLPSAEAVVGMVESLADELSYIEALRDLLLRPAQAMLAHTERLALGLRIGEGQRVETITQVNRLSVIALKQISTRFDEVDAQSGEVMSALRNIDSHQTFIRSNRDLLYRSFRAWEPILKEWDIFDPLAPETSWPLIGRTYQFLAPRYMPVQEWQATNSIRQRRSAKKIGNTMNW